MNVPLLLSFYAQMAVFPHPLSAWQMFPAQEQFNWLVALGWAGLVAMALLLLRASRRIQFWALWFVVSLLPVLQIIPFPIWVADRYLYVPLVGACVLLSQFSFWTWGRLRLSWPRWALEFAMLAVVVLLGQRTVRHVPVWANDLALWAATTPTCMTSAYCHMNLGLALLQNGQTELGVKELIRSVEIRGGAQFLERLGDAYALAVGDFRQAAIAYTLALEKSGDSSGSQVPAKLAGVLSGLVNLVDAMVILKLAC
jgi:hypothetical protein